MSTTCFADDPKYALSKFRVDGPKGTLHGATLVLLPLETPKFCEGALKGFRENALKQPEATIESQTCLTVLPAALLPILSGKSLLDGAYVKYSYSKYFFFKVTAWDLMYTTSLPDPNGYCARAIGAYIKNYGTAECKSAMH